VVATVSYNGVAVYTSESISATTIIFDGFLWFAGEENVSIAISPSSLAAQLGIYQIFSVDSLAQATLTLSVVAQNGGPFAASANLGVFGETVDPSWWSWSADQNVGNIQPFDSPGSSSFDWNTPYSLSGNFVNKSIWSAMKAQISLVETDSQTNTQALRSSQAFTADIGPNPNFVIFSPITQNWTWLSCPDGGRGAPTVKLFNYSVKISLQDPWGNAYLLTVGPYNVTVGIPVNKLQDASNAVAYWDEAMLFLASIFFAPAAGFLMPLAASQCGQAQDPPTPDFDYHSTSAIRIYEPPPPIGETAHIQTTISFLNLLLKLTAIVSALNQTEGKLIAAREDKDATAVSLQTKTYRRFEGELRATAQQVRSAVPNVVRELEAAPFASAENIRAAVRSLQMYGIPASFAKAISQAGCSSCTLRSFEESIRAVDPTTIPSLADSFILLAHGTLVSVGYVLKNADRVVTAGAPHTGVKKKLSHKSKRGH
jgi:hypothetical protein